MDISLSDVLWVGGSLIAFVFIRCLIPYVPTIAQFIRHVIVTRMDARYIPPSVNHSMDDPDEIAPQIASAPAGMTPAHARTGADGRTALARSARGAEGACAPENTPIIAFRTHQDQQAARRMIKHKITNPQADMLDTIRAGFPEIKSRSGDPRSKYQLYGKPMYNALFGEIEPAYPTLEAQRRPSVVVPSPADPPIVRSTFRESDPDLAYRPPE